MANLELSIQKAEEWVFTVSHPLAGRAFLVHAMDGNTGHLIPMPAAQRGHYAIKMQLTPGLHHFHWLSSNGCGYVNQGAKGLTALPARQSSVHPPMLPCEGGA